MQELHSYGQLSRNSQSPGESNAENSVYYNSIFIPYRVIHYRYLVAHGTSHWCRVSSVILSDFLQDKSQNGIPRYRCRSLAMAMLSPPLLPDPQHWPETVLFQISRNCFSFPDISGSLLLWCAASPARTREGNMHMNGAMVKQLHLPPGLQIFHKTTPIAKLPPGLL